MDKKEKKIITEEMKKTPTKKKTTQKKTTQKKTTQKKTSATPQKQATKKKTTTVKKQAPVIKTEEKKVQPKEIKTEEKKEKGKEKKKRPFNKRRALNIVFWLIILCCVIVLVDIACVTRLETGPFFAIRTKVYEDGGTEEFYGLGYKIIKYKQDNGRQGTQVGTWGLNYVTSPTEIELLDLAIEYRMDAKKTYEKYYNQYLMVIGTLESIDHQNKIVTLRYNDPDGKYTMDVAIHMHDKKVDLSSYQKGETMRIVGTLKNYENKTEKAPAKLILEDGFIK